MTEPVVQYVIRLDFTQTPEDRESYRKALADQISDLTRWAWAEYEKHHADTPPEGYQAGPQTAYGCAACGIPATQPGGLTSEHGRP
jgi:hypothetical protein